ncbi:LysR family transcriptional regulator [Stackebrandtia nassauensis]|uniref:Transcriptional regulator, LysR family n=1 Tax=Stackebrandtia nassauensis (strain DSM 44728 / CIP 108903 / NRRL B-16338 / NBRC 102104 / LLR-40K-21) TaxID=446470 RepID=D3Q9W6_STANL|nr:LysR family transcriptional regulator [Stackebrandtia nassauensis]ADD44662.1 transcriptional regulator, LysR family [Stackebrandtia nassauensis DSM 44728]
MELRQLEYLVAVVDEGGFTKAANRLHVAQPGVSAQIRLLERELGETLIDRSERTARPTEVGAAVLTHARAALAAVRGVRQAVDEFAGLVRGRVRIGTVTSHNIDVPGLLSEFHRRYPDVEITLTESNSAHLIAALGSGDLDIAITGITATPPPGLKVRMLAEEPLVAAVPDGDPLARYDSVSLSKLVSRELICLASGTAARTSIEEACAAKGLSPKVAFESGDPGLCARLAERGLGVAVLQKTIVDNRDGLRGIPIVRPSLRGWLVLGWRAEGPLSPAARELLRLARRRLPGLGD